MTTHLRDQGNQAEQAEEAQRAHQPQQTNQTHEIYEPHQTHQPPAGHPSGGPNPPKSGPLRLGGTAWLVWRQHRAAFWTLIALTLIGVAAMVFLRDRMTDYLDSLPQGSGGLPAEFETYLDRLTQAGDFLGYAPILVGVFLGAPLVAGDLETGTAKLVTAQSVSRLRWLTMKFALPAALIALCTGLLGIVFRWWWTPVRGRTDVLEWTSAAIFNVTGIMPVAYALLTFTVGVTVGVLLRRTLVSMVVTLGIIGAISLLWGRFKLDLGHLVTATTHHGAGPDSALPKLPAEAIQQGQGTSFLTSSGERLDWLTCTDKLDNAQAHAACLDSHHIVGRAIDYLPVSQMPTMQWLGAGIMFTLTVALVAFLVPWTRKRLL
ncbi:ABC transporter permease [Streptomyces sp. NPDC051561]|uniref:ABC transporter permease n=1 Tax=Streptomyces sp. NPDC051561 TaxID=3365658 RepID=UPI0037B951E9